MEFDKSVYKKNKKKKKDYKYNQFLLTLQVPFLEHICIFYFFFIFCNLNRSFDSAHIMTHNNEVEFLLPKIMKHKPLVV